jgi:carbonic anhydrase
MSVADMLQRNREWLHGWVYDIGTGLVTVVQDGSTPLT